MRQNDDVSRFSQVTGEREFKYREYSQQSQEPVKGEWALLDAVAASRGDMSVEPEYAAPLVADSPTAPSSDASWGLLSALQGRTPTAVSAPVATAPANAIVGEGRDTSDFARLFRKPSPPLSSGETVNAEASLRELLRGISSCR